MQHDTFGVGSESCHDRVVRAGGIRNTFGISQFSEGKLLGEQGYSAFDALVDVARHIQALAHRVDACKEAIKRSHGQQLDTTLMAIIMSLRAGQVRQHTRTQFTLDHSRMRWAALHDYPQARKRHSRALPTESYSFRGKCVKTDPNYQIRGS